MYELPDLEYAYNGLEPYISAKTVDVHYNLHHQGYLDRLNTLLKNVGYDNTHDLVWLVEHIDTIPLELERGSILYNAMAVLNHNLYWRSMNPNHRMPTGKLRQQIEKQYGNYDNFQREFKKTATSLIGSGYTFLTTNQKGELTIMNTSNQDSPYVYGFTPLMTIDLWEHSYYLDYLNKRSDYIDNFFQIVDFDYANKKYEDIVSKTQ